MTCLGVCFLCFVLFFDFFFFYIASLPNYKPSCKLEAWNLPFLGEVEWWTEVAQPGVQCWLQGCSSPRGHGHSCWGHAEVLQWCWRSAWSPSTSPASSRSLQPWFFLVPLTPGLLPLLPISGHHCLFIAFFCSLLGQSGLSQRQGFSSLPMPAPVPN